MVDVTRRMTLSPAELARYARHLAIPEVGLEGQKRLKSASVLLVGAGGLGSPAALYLAAAGVGRLGVVDADPVETSNLQRQVLHDTEDVGRPKTDSARERLEALNPHVRVETHAVRLDSTNALEVLDGWDVVVDGSDNFPTRYLVSDACVLLGIPDVFGAILRFEGQVSVFAADQGPCYRCLFREPPPPDLVPGCAEAGVLGILPGLVGTIQATEVIKLVLGIGESLAGRLLLIDALGMDFRELRIRKDPECPACGERPTITELIDYEEFCGMKSEAASTAAAGAAVSVARAGAPARTRDGTAKAAANRREQASSVQQSADGAAAPPPAPGRPGIPDIDVSDLRDRLQAETPPPPRLIDVRDPWEWDVSNLGSVGEVLRIPLPELMTRLDELDKDEELVLYCRGGDRSGQAVLMLRELGYGRAVQLRGGINAWAEENDPAMAQY